MILYPYVTSPGRICKAELIRDIKIKRPNEMINFDQVTGDNRHARNLE